MKTIFLRVIIVLELIINLTACKAQQIQPLNTNLKDITSNSYLKDLNNELDSYVGNFSANFDGKIINLFITKEVKKKIDLQTKSYY